MSQRSNKARQGKAAAVHSSAPGLPAGEMPGVEGACRLESESRPPGLNGRWTAAGVCIFLAVATWLVFGQTLRFEFVNYDDNVQVYEVQQIENGLTLNGILWAFTHRHYGHWIPLNTISHMLDSQLYGLKAGGHHFTNVLLHAATAILLFLVLRRMTATIWPGAFVAAVFAVHPLHVESVAWVAERKDVLSGFFFMLTLWAYVRHVQNQPRINGRGSNGITADRAITSRPWDLDYSLALLFFACGLMSKMMVATLPLVLLFLDYWPLNRFVQPASGKAGSKKSQWLIPRQLILEKIPMLGIIFMAGLGMLFARPENGAILGPLPRSLQTGRALLTPLTYLWQMVYPVGLSVSPPSPAIAPLVWEVTLGTILLVAISAAFFLWRRVRPYLLVGWSWYLVMLAPVLVLIGTGMELRCDRYTYLPQIGLYLLLAWAAADLCAGWRHRRVVLGGCATIILAALIVCARTQTAYWRNSESLWTHTLACTSGNYVAHNNLGNALLQKGSVNEAIAHFQKALQIKPDNAEAHYNLGNALFKKGSLDEAIVHFQKALQITPDNVEAHNNLGNALLQKGNADEAITHYQKALQINPDYSEAHNNLGSVLLQKSNVDEAITHFQKALQITPDYSEAHINLGYALLKKGNVDEAMVHYQKALQINPDDANAHINLGNILLGKGNVDEAIVHYQKALQIKPDDADAHNNLGYALVQKSSVDEAITHFKRALQINPDFVDARKNLSNALIKIRDNP
jgi:Tfp pilus assembly protein PilF